MPSESEISRLYPYLVGLAEVIVQDRCAAQDIVQDAWVRALEGNGYDPSRGSTFRTWITTYVLSEAVDFLRNRRREHQRHASLSDDTVIEEIEAKAVRPTDKFSVAIDVDTALNELPPEEAAVLRRIWYEGYTLDELAARFPEYRGSRYAVHRLHQRAKAHLRKRLLAYTA